MHHASQITGAIFLEIAVYNDIAKGLRNYTKSSNFVLPQLDPPQFCLGSLLSHGGAN